jgi:hypothetical protein
MKFLLTILVVLGFTLFSSGQSVPRFQKGDISNSGCKAYFPNTIPTFELSYSEDSSKVYVGEVKVDEFAFGIICVKFVEKMDISNSDKETLLISYLDFLKTTFKIKEAVGYGKGHTLESCPSALGVIDYWQDEQGDAWQVKGWINESHLSVMYIYGKSDYPNINISGMFLNGFRFPEK